ncbi:hypothetical protein [Tenacibaculum finnmarkense]|uniref:hypothetical protein n=1 Tax=Tenacibaculum finnmarkense TaxID=2781243 RepID=UPI001EFB6206|nr:hypothetical protein [Tenacibaculum finnmarkense]MCG8208206.1 hypothetical protein [Tenacibaculum finnmarkense genomovar finnmarkense]MCG8724247.1 hypothetical protein [Tenacibaculum finnmarkense]MCG8742503.1 hypothetical protein [Tenacibaculum finnmarkense]MCG8765903.1 hypothetical protein [Tenacibaculum finnmarkense]MCG8778968.1 hypothetical protein [Tenacibaculum finnmarkense]
MSDFFNQFFCEKNNEYSLIIEDDKRVVYAYLLKGEDVVSDVWLYNNNVTPEKVDWNDVGEVPFLNPSIYTDNNKGKAELKSTGIEWLILNTVKVKLLLDNGVEVILEEGMKPGWSNNVIKSGPLAQKLEN